MEYRSNFYAVCTENSHKRNCYTEKKRKQNKKTDAETKVKKKLVKHFFFVKATVGLVIHEDLRAPHLLVSCLLTGHAVFVLRYMSFIWYDLL